MRLLQESFQNSVLVETETSCLRPFLMNILDVKDSTVGEAIKVNWNSTILSCMLNAWEAKSWLTVIWLSHGAHKHPLW